MRLETVTNYAILAMAATVMVSSGTLMLRGRAADKSPAKKISYAVAEKVGNDVPLDFSKADNTLLLVVYSGCKFCTASMPFYQSLIKQRTQSMNPLRIVAAAPEPVENARAYLTQHGVVPDDIVQIPAGQNRFAGTPTIAVVKRNREIAGIWVGQLKDQQERAIEAMAFDKH